MRRARQPRSDAHSRACSSKDLKRHLRGVYQTLALSCGAAALGSFAVLTMPLFQSSRVALLCTVASFALIFAILGSAAQGPTESRVAMIALFGFLAGAPLRRCVATLTGAQACRPARWLRLHPSWTLPWCSPPWPAPR